MEGVSGKDHHMVWVGHTYVVNDTGHGPARPKGLALWKLTGADWTNYAQRVVTECDAANMAVQAQGGGVVERAQAMQAAMHAVAEALVDGRQAETRQAREDAQRAKREKRQGRSAQTGAVDMRTTTAKRTWRRRSLRQSSQASWSIRNSADCHCHRHGASGGLRTSSVGPHELD